MLYGQRSLQDCDSDDDRVMADSGEERDVSVYPSGASTPQSEYNTLPFRLLFRVLAWLLGLSCVYAGAYQTGSDCSSLYVAMPTCKRKCMQPLSLDSGIAVIGWLVIT